LPDAALVVEHIKGYEALSDCYRFEIVCLSSSAHFELKQLIGEQVTLRLLLADGRSYRHWHGMVMGASVLGSDGGVARYSIVMEPWLACLHQTRNSRVFQDMTVQDTASELSRHS
jgi:type VI secretion system secreted protein VgrG